MLMDSLLSEMRSTSPPFQPFLRTWGKDYVEQKLAWHPNCIKKDGLFYQFRTGDESWAIPILPDACINFLIECNASHPQTVLCGIRTSEAMLRTRPNTLYFGFKPYTSLGIRQDKVRFSELVSRSMDFTDVFQNGGQAAEEIISAGSFEERVSLMLRFAQEHMVDPDYTPVLSEYLAITLCANEGNIALGKMDAVTGYSARHVREKFRESYGISPKQYGNIMRFQSAMKYLIQSDKKTLAAVANEAGYYDQAHFIHSFKEYASISPMDFRAVLAQGNRE